jgi:hypothetical protein
VAALVVLVGLLAGVGCGMEFEPYWRVSSYRLLAIQADPPAMKPGDVATFRALDYRPDGVEVSYEWSWCPVEPSAQERYDCPIDEVVAGGADAGISADAGMGGGGGGGFGGFDPSIFELGTDETAVLSYPGTRDQVFELCQSIQQAVAQAEEESGLTGLLPTTDCERGYDINIRLKATPEGGEPIVARKRVKLWTGGEANQNPRQTGLQIRPISQEVADRVRGTLDWVEPPGTPLSEQWYTMPIDAKTVLANGAKYQVRVQVDRSRIEEWRPPAPTGSQMERLPPEEEAIEFQWFVSGGELDPASRVYQKDFDNFEKARQTDWNIPIEDIEPCKEGRGACDVRLWTVMRDGRLGVDWAERTVKIVEKTDGGDQ